MKVKVEPLPTSLITQIRPPSGTGHSLSKRLVSDASGTTERSARGAPATTPARKDEMADGPKLALFGLHRGSSADPDTLGRRARRAEEAGFESFWVGDHVALPSAEAQGADPPGQRRLEALVALAYMAALTSRVRLAVGVIVLPQRQPVLLAKQLSTIDVLSKGRLIVGIGVGYLEPELRALGASLADRGARTDEYLAAMRALWDEPAPSFAGLPAGDLG
jgi:alkanesulfonate monooxygenase SsuD/methylene tetrahydromethanopterin reductase-like flavin-dependent oxidoreductase (luciferase family)